MLAPYDVASVCVKCGHQGIRTRYHRIGDPALLLASVHRPPCADAVNALPSEHLDCTCLNCGYIWPAACLAAPHDHTWSADVERLQDYAEYVYFSPCTVAGCDARLARPDPLAALPYQVKRGRTIPPTLDRNYYR